LLLFHGYGFLSRSLLSQEPRNRGFHSGVHTLLVTRESRPHERELRDEVRTTSYVMRHRTKTGSDCGSEVVQESECVKARSLPGSTALTSVEPRCRGDVSPLPAATAEDVAAVAERVPRKTSKKPAGWTFANRDAGGRTPSLDEATRTLYQRRSRSTTM
jgi:hypothetical protein